MSLPSSRLSFSFMRRSRSSCTGRWETSPIADTSFVPWGALYASRVEIYAGGVRIVYCIDQDRAAQAHPRERTPPRGWPVVLLFCGVLRGGNQQVARGLGARERKGAMAMRGLVNGGLCVTKREHDAARDSSHQLQGSTEQCEDRYSLCRVLRVF